MESHRRWWIVVLLITLGAAAVMYWRARSNGAGDADFTSGNGRIEAVEIDIAARSAGRIREVLVDEGATVQAGQVVARMDTDTLKAQLREARAQVKRAQSAQVTAAAVVRQREGVRSTASAVVAQRRSELTLAENDLKRTQELVGRGFVTSQKADSDRARLQGAQAALAAAQSQVLEAESAIAAARSQATEAASAVEAGEATVERLKVEIADADLKAPRTGRVQHRIAQPGEVVGAGGKVLTLVDLSDVYMTFFLPETLAGRLAIGAEARLIIDAAPQYVIPATISFVASEAQFTPRTVETKSERQKLTFRVKARVEPALVARYLDRVKTGLPGVAHVRLNPEAQWPANLTVRLPQ